MSKKDNPKISDEKISDVIEIPNDANGSIASLSGLVLPDQVLPANLFVLPVHSAVIYPTLMAPLIVSEPRFVATVEESINRQRFLGLVLIKNDQTELRNIKAEDLYSLGVVVKIIKRLKLPDGSINLLVHSVKRFKTKKMISESPHFVCQAEYLNDTSEKSLEMDALTRTAIAHVKQLSEVNPFFSEEMKLAMINAPGPGTVSDLVAFALALPRKDAQDFLETLSVKERFEKLLVLLKREQDVADLQRKIQEDVNSKINSMQRDFFLKEQLKAIKKELGMEEDGKAQSARTYREKIEALKMPEDVKKTALEELSKFETISEQSPEYNIARNYMDILCGLPWGIETQDDLSIEHAEKILDEDHFGLEKVKERILEFLAVRKLKGDAFKKPTSEKQKDEGLKKRGSIICLVGPPGVGKTSIGKSIARSLNRNFYRFSLGGMRDEAEIKGHRRTYIGAMPGKIIQAMKRAGSQNPVILLDEIDKLSNSYQGDPASALLEVLDPEQNTMFLDHYLDLPFDLSSVIFIATANSIGDIPEPLLDRMELIEIPGYTLEEKEKIALQYLIPKVFEENAIKNQDLKIEKDALKQIILDYAREPGVRNLQKQIDRIVRKAARKMVQHQEQQKDTKKRLIKKPNQLRVKKDELKEWLGPKRYYNELLERITVPGVVVGMAWTSVGGDILFIEATDIPGSGQLKLTGQMGEVMVESANIAWTYVKKLLSIENILDKEFLKEKDIHLHIPAGAIPKDGPSAGITMATALYSLISGRMAKPRLSMTGELSLTGKVLPVGGIKEKVLAAKRVGVKTIILPKLNEKDLEDLPDYAKTGLEFHFVSKLEEVFQIALIKKVVKKPVISKLTMKKTLNPEVSLPQLKVAKAYLKAKKRKK